MAPTVFRKDGFRGNFFSREETRMHIHVNHPDGEVKIWLEPKIEVAQSQGLKAHQVKAALQLVREFEDEIRKAWHDHFSS